MSGQLGDRLLVGLQRPLYDAAVLLCGPAGDVCAVFLTSFCPHGVEIWSNRYVSRMYHGR